jgi:hypothetical protein
MAAQQHLKSVDGGRGDGGGLDLEHRLTAIETRLDALASKADVSEAKSSIVQWIVGTSLGMGALALTVMTFVLNNAVPKPAPQSASAQLQPIVIALPTLMSPPAPIAGPASSPASAASR